MTRRVPLLSGTRLLAIDAPGEAVVLRPPPPGIGIVDVGAAVREALSFPLSGPALEQLVTRGGRATVVVEPPALPIPSSSRDPREAAIEATVDELTRLGVDQARQTLLVASGLHRRPGRAELGELVAPEFARRFRGRVEVHDASDPGLVTANEHGSAPVRVHPALTETDLLVVVSAAETVLHGGP
ncbi:MAG: DUF2088 domain-containing protein, partial [Actinobacteria bacterium]|nr:DUF2088 domain-containing protein [Actinomycetota bacterium]